MTIDEAITHAREVANEQKRRSGICVQNDSECDKFSDCLKCAEEHEQIAECLEELKFLRQWKSDVMDEFCKYDCNSVEEARHNAYNKAIDDFVKAIVCRGLSSNYDKYCITSYDNYLKVIKEIAEQLKEGV